MAEIEAGEAMVSVNGSEARIATPRHAIYRRGAALLLTALATLAFVGVTAEIAARLAFRESRTSTLPCLVVDDPSTGVRGRPNTRCEQKTPESAPIEYRFNECGYRTPAACFGKRPGVFRIVIIGSSYVMGMHVPGDRAFAALLGGELSRRLHRPIEVFNEGMQWGTPASLALRTGDMIRARPDLILWAPTPLDIENAGAVTPFLAGGQPGIMRPERRSAAAAGPSAGPPAAAPPRRSPVALAGIAWKRLTDMLGQTRTAFAMQHFLYRSDSQYLDHALLQGSQIDYLRAAPGAAWADDLRVFGDTLGEIVAAGRRVGAPVVVALLPFREQAIMIGQGTPPSGFDPRAMGRSVAPVVTKMGAFYVDSLRGAAVPSPTTDLFYPVDQHLTVRGHAWMASLLADELVAQGALRAAAVPTADAHESGQG